MTWLDASVSIQMWHSGWKCWRIGALVKANRKRLKADLALGVKKLGPDSVAPKIGKFPLFDGFFPDLADFRDLNVFWLFNFLDFLACSTPSPLNQSNSPSPSFFLEASLLSSFLLKADFLPLFLLRVSLLVVFNIEMNRTTILLNPWINRW